MTEDSVNGVIITTGIVVVVAAIIAACSYDGYLTAECLKNASSVEIARLCRGH